MLKYAFDSRTVVCIALTRNYTQCVFLIDTEKSKILAAVNHLYSIPFKIKDVIFKPKSRTEFITCGIQHMSFWSYKGDVLNCREFPLKMNQIKTKRPDHKDNDAGEGADENVFRITFLCIIFIMDHIITGAEDGSVRSSNPVVPLEG